MNDAVIPMSSLAPRPSAAEARRFAVVGLGYVGLPVATALGRRWGRVVGFDIDATRIDELESGHDRTQETTRSELESADLRFSADAGALADADFFVVTVPTPVDSHHIPDLAILEAATRTIGEHLRPGAVVVYESTVYPGVTEDICAPLLAQVSGLSRDQFRVAYSPERINPGDREHTLNQVIKVVAAEDDETLDLVAEVYGSIVDAGIHRAPSIKAAEAAKVLENTQRDLNIALMNELSMVCDRLGVRTLDVLAAAETKWNFLPFRPGLVGGHCIGVDPYYLTAKAQELGLHPEVILAGRRINDSMGSFVASAVVRLLARHRERVGGARVGLLGLTFKENVPDIRNSRVPDIIEVLAEHGVEVVAHDPRADRGQVQRELGLELRGWDELDGVDALVLAVPHREYLEMPATELLRAAAPGAPVIDVKSVLDPGEIGGHPYWSL